MTTYSKPTRQDLGLCSRPAGHDCAGEMVAYMLHTSQESIDGPRYAEAIRGANEMRRKAFLFASFLPGTTYHRLIGQAWAFERAYGCPVGFWTILDNRETPRMTVGEMTEAWGK